MRQECALSGVSQTRIFMQPDGGSQAGFARVVTHYATFWLSPPPLVASR